MPLYRTWMTVSMPFFCLLMELMMSRMRRVYSPRWIVLFMRPYSSSRALAFSSRSLISLTIEGISDLYRQGQG